MPLGLDDGVGLTVPPELGDTLAVGLAELDDDVDGLDVPLALPLGVAVTVGAPEDDGEPELVAVGRALLLVDGDALGVRDEAAD